MMEALMALYIIALMYRATKANAVELAECIEHVIHDSFTRLLVLTVQRQLVLSLGREFYSVFRLDLQKGGGVRYCVFTDD